MSISRRNRLKALGNAVVPQIAEVIGRAILAVATQRQAPDATRSPSAPDRALAGHRDANTWHITGTTYADLGLDPPVIDRPVYRSQDGPPQVIAIIEEKE